MTIDNDPEPEKISRSFFDAAQGRKVGDDILPAAREIVNHYGNVGAAPATLRAWRRAHLVVLETKQMGKQPHRKRVVVAVYLTPKGVEACCLHEARLADRIVRYGPRFVMRQHEKAEHDKAAT